MNDIANRVVGRARDDIERTCAIPGLGAPSALDTPTVVRKKSSGVAAGTALPARAMVRTVIASDVICRV